MPVNFLMPEIYLRHIPCLILISTELRDLINVKNVYVPTFNPYLPGQGKRMTLFTLRPHKVKNIHLKNIKNHTLWQRFPEMMARTSTEP
jgi:hypothetical protein